MLKIFDTYSGKTEVFEPLNQGKVTMYVCGPTVYDFPHLGHARCYITWDVLYRYLKALGYAVRYCRNVTDVDDKIINKAKSLGVTPSEVAKKFYDIFCEDMKRLNVSKPDIEPFATKNIKQMLDIIKTIEDKGFAYEVDGDVYFRVKKFKNYGQLSKQPIDDLVAGARVEKSEIKEDSLDFALWKKDDEFGYDSQYGKGRPGWHIECSAMSKDSLGSQIDIHAGGADLIFPHHENEIAQSECANGCKFSKYWMHNGFVTINKEKMSKSLNNFVSIDKMLEAYDSNTLRLFILTNHYRMPVEFSDDALISAQAGTKRLANAVKEGLNTVNLEELVKKPKNEAVELFMSVMDEDLNTSKALAILFDLAGKTNKAKAENNKDILKESLSTLIYLSEILGFDFTTKSTNNDKLRKNLLAVIEEFDFLDQSDKENDTDAIMQKIIAIRAKARADKDFALADKIRGTLDKAQIVLKDNKEQATSYSLK